MKLTQFLILGSTLSFVTAPIVHAESPLDEEELERDTNTTEIHPAASEKEQNPPAVDANPWDPRPGHH